jgi:hypothetical protein
MRARGFKSARAMLGNLTERPPPGGPSSLIDVFQAAARAFRSLRQPADLAADARSEQWESGGGFDRRRHNEHFVRTFRRSK